MKRRASRIAVVLLALALLPQPAHAAENRVEDLQTARRLYDAGAQAYASGQFPAAIQAFEQANQLAPRPAILFSLAQAQRRQYFIDKQPAHLRAALANYRAYVKENPSGARLADAAQALQELELVEARVATDANAKPLPREPARIMVMSRTPGALASVDGKPAKPTPIAVEVTKGVHRIVVTAVGFHPEQRDAEAVENAIVPVDIPLREVDASLVVESLGGAEITVDSRYVGEAGSAIPITPGTRFVTVTKRGYSTVSQEIDFARAERREVAIPLQMTAQRRLAFGFLGIAAAGALVSGATALASLGHEASANDVLDKRAQQDITEGERREYDHQRKLRNDTRTAAMVSGGVAGGALVVGALLWLFDKPAPPPPPSRRRDMPAPAPREVEIEPGPGLIGAGISKRF